MSIGLVMHPIPYNTAVKPTHHGETYGESKASTETYDEEGEHFAAFLCIRNEAVTTIAPISFLGGGVCARWELVFDAPRVNTRVAVTLVVIFGPLHGALRLVASLNSVCDEACRAFQVSITAKLTEKALKMEVVILAPVHKDDIVERHLT